MTNMASPGSPWWQTLPDGKVHALAGEGQQLQLRRFHLAKIGTSLSSSTLR